MHAYINNQLKCVSVIKVTPTPTVQTAAEENSGAAVFLIFLTHSLVMSMGIHSGLRVFSSWPCLLQPHWCLHAMKGTL